MRPVKVEFQAFGPYVGHEIVDFEAISGNGLFLICGKTGIGKTMILDAMTFALYGKSSGHGRDDFEAMRCTNADYAMATFVRFEFENHGVFYCFERRIERKRKNLSASYNVSTRGEDGLWKPLMENPKKKALNEKAVEIIGLEYDQFRQVIVLPQGQFEKLLTSDSSEKEKILTSIFGEEKWQILADQFYDKAEARKNELKGVQENIRIKLAEENCDSINQLELAVSHKKQEAAELEEEYRKADYDRIIREQQESLSVARRFGDLHKAEEKLKKLEARKEDRDVWEVKLNDAKRTDKIRLLIEAKDGARAALDKRIKEEAEANGIAEVKKEEVEKASGQVKEHALKEKEAGSLRIRKIQYEGRRKDYEGLDEAEKNLKGKEKLALEVLKEEEEAKKKRDAYTDLIFKLKRDYNALESEHEALLNSFLAGITGDLAEKLEEGRPCPVCGSTRHPHKAHISENRVTEAKVRSKKKAAIQKYEEMQDKVTEQQEAGKLLDEKHSASEEVKGEVARLSAQLKERKKNLIEGIPTARELERAVKKLGREIEDYEEKKRRLAELEKEAKDAYTEARAKTGSAQRERKRAESQLADAAEALDHGLRENRFASEEEAKKFMLPAREVEKLSAGIANYDAEVKTAGDHLAGLQKELRGIKEPDETTCREILEKANNAKGEYREKKAVLNQQIERLQNKADELKEEGAGIEEKIRQADEDYAFARKLRGDSGTGLQRYVLGIMFSSVVASANKMLEMVHGGRYRLFRSDEKAQGTNKRGLELKVFDRNSEEHDGRFVSTLSGGEKFLVSLALSIGMSTVAQKTGIKIEALFIDEGFGSLDDESIGDAMSVLNSIQEANGMVGIISHVQILQDQIPVKLRVEEDGRGSHIVQAIG